MNPAQAMLLTATLLCSVVAGFLFAFSAVVMPGLGKLDDRNFIRAFQVVDGVIQDNHPLFLLVWAGSVVALIAAVALNLNQLAGPDRALLLVAAFGYLGGVQLPTLTINVPLNNELQRLDVETIDEVARRAGREGFESRWNRWNEIRTSAACLSAAMLMILLLHL